VTAGLCSLADLKVVREAGAPLASAVTFEAFVDLLYNLGQQAANGETNIAGASLAVPFPFDCVAGVSLMQHKLTALYGKSLRNALAARFNWPPDRFRFLNDAGAFLLGEVSTGAARGAARAVGLTLGTGIGCAFAVDGANVTDGEGVPPGGEIWNLPYGNGTVEDLISTHAVKSEYLAQTGRNLEVSAIAAAAPRDADARAVFEKFGDHLGQVLRDIIAPFHPDIVVIGGGISRSTPLFLPAAEKQIVDLGFRVVQSALQDQAPLAGAAYYWCKGVTMPHRKHKKAHDSATNPAPDHTPVVITTESSAVTVTVETLDATAPGPATPDHTPVVITTDGS
jgi:predicted NBD/HSP70 family sugar kinase